MSRTTRRLPSWLRAETFDPDYVAAWQRGQRASALGSVLILDGKLIRSGWDETESPGGRRFLKRQARRASRRAASSINEV